MRITLLPAPNGVGHIMRMLDLAKILTEFDHKIQLIVPSYSIAYLKLSTKIKHFSVIYIPWNKNKIEFNNEIKEYCTLVSQIADLEFIISDNLLEIFNFGKKVLLSANFFWEDQADFISESDGKKMRALIRDLNLPIVANRYFKSQSIKNHKNIKEVGFYSANLLKPRSGLERNLLISVGVSGWVKTNELEMFYKQFSNGLFDRFKAIFVDPRLMEVLSRQIPRHKYPLKLAEYDQGMYNKISDAIVRPGLSTIQNLLAVGAHIFPINFGNTQEIKFNSQIIASLGIGLIFKKKDIMSEVNKHRLRHYDSTQFFSSKQQVNDVFTDPKNFTSI